MEEHMREERMEILNLLKQGKISVDEAERLLNALESGDRDQRRHSPHGSRPDMEMHDFPGFRAMGQAFRTFGKTFGSTMRSAFGSHSPFGHFDEPFAEWEDFKEVDVDPDGVYIEAPFTMQIRQPKHPHRAGGDVEICASETDRVRVESDGAVEIRRRGPVLALIVHDDCCIFVPEGCKQTQVGLFNGDVTAKDVPGEIDIHTMSGDIELENVTLGKGCATMSGDVEARSVRTVNTLVEITTLSGDIDVQLSPDVVGKVRMETLSGEVESGFASANVKEMGGFVGKRMRVDLEGPEDKAINCKTLSGDISLQPFK
jgi:hypothetical protein